MIFNLKNTVSQFKRLIGRKFSDPVVLEEKKRLSCQLVERPGDCIGVKVSPLKNLKPFAVILTRNSISKWM